MRDLIKKAGRFKTTVIITFASILMSLTITLTIMVANHTEISAVAITVSVLAPMIISPLMIWYIVGLLLEIHQLELTQRKLASTDELTQLMTRRAFMENSTTLLNQAERSNVDFVVAMMDLDNFKKINDRYGHGGGDAVLRSFAGILRGRMRRSDVTGRVGGEEFAVSLFSTGVDAARQLLEEMRREVEADRVAFQNEIIQYTISIGIAAHHSKHKPGIDAVLIDADAALYQAKNTGKNRVVVKEPDAQAC